MITQSELTGRLAALLAYQELVGQIGSLSSQERVNLALLAGCGSSDFRVSTATFNRPADTTAYAQNDLVSNSTSATTPIEFTAVVGSAAGSGEIVSAQLITNKNVIAISGAAVTFRLWIYTATPASPPNDNAAFQQGWANRLVRIGFVDFNNAIAGSDCADWTGIVASTTGTLPFALTAGTSLFGLLQYTGTGSYTPDSGQTFLVRLGIR